MEPAILFAIFFPILISPLFFVLQRVVPEQLGLVSATIALLAFLGIVEIWHTFDTSDPQVFMIPWVPSAGVNLSFVVDGLSLFFAILATGMGVLVSYYANYYMDSKDQSLGRFYCCLNFFMGSMLGAIFADNLLLMFLFWELTGVASFLLIGYDYDQEEACKSARMALLVTSLTSLALLIGILLIGVLDQTFLWTEIVKMGIAYGQHEYWSYVIIICFLVAIFGKSAQFPLHFWLPKAMTAPTPVSAYLHAATMVKLGIYLTARMYPLFVNNPIWFPTLTTFCFATMLLGATLSLLSNDLKTILAYATVSQLGFFIGFYGMGDANGVQYDFVHIFNHALYKGSLFMLVGIVTHATGIRDIRQLGGLWKKMPLTTVSFLIAAAAMAGVPGTTGFLSKEMLLSDVVVFGRAHHSGVIILGVLLTALLFKVAFSLRLFYHLFIRKLENPSATFHPPSLQVQLSPLVLSVTAFTLGLWPKGLENLSQSFFVSGLHKTDPRTLSIWHGWTVEFLISGFIFVVGALLFWGAEKAGLWWVKHPFPFFSDLWEQIVEGIQKGAKTVTRWIHSPRPDVYLGILLAAFAVGVGGILLNTLLNGGSLPIAKMGTPVRASAALLLAISTVSILFFKSRVGKLAALSTSGFSLTLYFALNKAPDLAMTQLLVEVITLFILLILFWAMKNNHKSIQFSFWKLLIAISTGITASLIALSFQVDTTGSNLRDFFLNNSIPIAKGTNAVNTILVDFRGLDTLGEVTVLVIVSLGVVGMLFRRTEPWYIHKTQVSLVPSDILRFVIPFIFFLTNVFALYLLLRGHNFPGGGFIAGLAAGISFSLLVMVIQIFELLSLFRIRAFKLTFVGLLIMVITGIIPTLFGNKFLEHNTGLINTTLLFDLGVSLSVMGMSILIVFAMRNEALAEESPL